MAWIVGRQASGLHLSEAEALQVAVRISDSGEPISVIGDRLELLRIELVKALDANAAVFLWTGRTSPEEGVEVFSLASASERGSGPAALDA